MPSIKRSITSELFIEIGVEEMPSGVIAQTLAALRENAERLTKEAALSHAPFEVFGTPRRLILYTPSLSEKQEDRIETLMGPPKKISFDAEGNPTPAAIGFAKLHNIPVSKLSVVQTEKGEYLSVEKKTIGKPTSAILKDLIPEIIASLRFPKAMRWNGTISFIRPIRWMVALYNLKTVSYSFAAVKSGNRSFGHRLLAPESFLVTTFASYKKEIRKRFVIIDPNERHSKIKQGINDIVKKVSGIVEEDDALLWKAAYSTEYPEVICGTFDKGFLTIPKEIIATAMKEHQGYFPVSEKKETQNALPHFIAVINNKDKKGIIQKGCERVLRARLSDARFCFEEDCKLTLEKRVPALKGVSFQNKLGTLYDKTERIVAVSKWIAQKIEAVTPAISQQGKGGILEEVRQIAPLCKADLITGVVREFPSLQGVMGRVLMSRHSESEETASHLNADAIEEHYQPRFSGDALPKRLLGQILSVSDKIDTIVGCFGIGMIPTGSEDPYALRRQGLGLIQILSSNRTFRPFFLPDLVLESVRYYENQKISFKTNPTLDVSQFLKLRMVSYLQLGGARHDIVNTVLTNKTLIPFPPCDIFAMAEALSAFCTKPLFNPLITCYKRAARILVSGLNVKVNPALFKEKVEGTLWRSILEAVKEVDIRYERPDFNGVLEALATLYVPLNQFFSDVLVMDPSEEIRKNRMALLRVVVNLFDRFGDFSKIQEAGEANK